eukprot:scaffold6735_cov124-Isochrysis_galbana.AAC.4
MRCIPVRHRRRVPLRKPAMRTSDSPQEEAPGSPPDAPRAPGNAARIVRPSLAEPRGPHRGVPVPRSRCRPGGRLAGPRGGHPHRSTNNTRSFGPASPPTHNRKNYSHAPRWEPRRRTWPLPWGARLGTHLVPQPP